MQMKSEGQMAFEAFARYLGGENGAPWEELNPAMWGAWEAAVDAVRPEISDTVRLDYLIRIIQEWGTEGLLQRVDWGIGNDFDRDAIDHSMENPIWQ